MSMTSPYVEQPEIEVPVQGCDRQLRWPTMVAASAAPSSGPDGPIRSWCELSPLHAGTALVGAGLLDPDAAPAIDAAAVREVVWATALAGGRLTDVLSTALPANRPDLAAVYAIADPMTRRLELAVHGSCVSALLIQDTRESSAPLEVRGAGTTTALTATAPEGSTLVLIAHPGWHNPTSLTVQQVLDVEIADGNEQLAALRLCGLLRNRARWSDAAVVVIHFARSEGLLIPRGVTGGPLADGRTIVTDHRNQGSGPPIRIPGGTSPLPTPPWAPDTVGAVAGAEGS